MKSWEDILKRRFSDHVAPGKPGQDDALWNAIESGMAVPPSGSGAVAGLLGKKTRWILGSAAAVALIALGVGFWNDAETAPSSAEDLTEQNPPSEMPTAAEELVPSVSTPAAIPAEEGEMPTRTESDVADGAEGGTAVGAKVENESILNGEGAASAVAAMRNKVKDGTAQTGERSVQAIKENGDNPASDGPAGPPGRSSNVLLSGSDFVAAVGTATEQAASGEDAEAGQDAVNLLSEEDGDMDIPSLQETLRFVPLELRSPQLGSDVAAELLPMTRAVNAEVPLALRSYGGLTFSHFNLKGEHPAELSGYFHTDFSAGGGVAMDVRKWGQSFSLGLAWYDYVHLLDYVETTTHEFIDPEGIQSIEINELTGDTVAIITGDVVGLATQHRYVRSYNRYNAVVIPLEWRRERSRGRWHAGWGVGVQLLVRSGGKGHSLSKEGLVVAYSDSDLPGSRLNATPTGRLYMGYQIAPEWRLDLSMGAGLQRFRSRRVAEVLLTEPPQWDGQLLTGQCQFGVTRFISSR